MNIFQNRDVFFGKPNFINIRSHIHEFWSMAGEIKKELGESSYHLDSYLNVIFETLADMDLATASAVADKICSNILGDCCIVLNGEEYREKSNFFELVKKYIDEHPTDFKENHTKVEYYTGNIIFENLELLYREFRKRYKKKFWSNVDYPVASECYKKISAIIGEEKMERFNDILCEAFIPSPIGVSVMQQFLIQALGMLLYQDPENSKKIYQIMLSKHNLCK